MDTGTHRRLSLVLVLGLLLAGAGGCSAPDELTVYAASSLADALEAAATSYDRPVLIRAGASGHLAAAIRQGAPADLFLSAHREWGDRLRSDGLLLDDPVMVAGNHLLVVTPADRELPENTLKAISPPNRVAVGDPETVPVGRYAFQALQVTGRWSWLAERRVEAESARAVLALVERGAVDAGIVFASDATRSDRVQVVGPVSDQLHDPIEYTAAVVRDSRRPEEARRFLEFLRGPLGQSILAEYGFVTGSAP